jgi:acetate kinase
MSETLLVINAGSSSVKFSLFGREAALPLLASGKVENIGGAAVLEAEDAHDALGPVTHEDALRHILGWIEKRDHGKVIAAAHRVVHGGTEFTAPCRATPETMTRLAALSPLAPLHQPHNLAAVDILGRLMPGLPQALCFDTAFHADRDELFTLYAVPDALREKGVRRYGFHGLSYEWIAGVLRRDHPRLFAGRVVAAHLGNGASLCAMRSGKSVDTTMGMTALEGLPMGTRCGGLDPGAAIYMIRDLGMTPDDAEHLLYNDCGLKGLSGRSNDMRALLQNPDEKARRALGYFALKTAQGVAAMAASLGGLDALVFTGGIGENAGPVRDDILKRLAFLGTFETLVIPANEERVIARQAAGCLG